MATPKRNLTPKDAARQLGLARNLIYQAIDDGRLKARKDKGRILITPEALKSFKTNLARPSKRISAKARRPDQNETIGDRLIEIREACNLTQFEIAERFGVSQNAIKNFELNLRRIPHELLIAYARLGNVTIDWILLGQ